MHRTQFGEHSLLALEGIDLRSSDAPDLAAAHLPPEAWERLLGAERFHQARPRGRETSPAAGGFAFGPWTRLCRP